MHENYFLFTKCGPKENLKQNIMPLKSTKYSLLGEQEIKYVVTQCG